MDRQFFVFFSPRWYCGSHRAPRLHKMGSAQAYLYTFLAGSTPFLTVWLFKWMFTKHVTRQKSNATQYATVSGRNENDTKIDESDDSDDSEDIGDLNSFPSRMSYTRDGSRLINVRFPLPQRISVADAWKGVSDVENVFLFIPYILSVVEVETLPKTSVLQQTTNSPNSPCGNGEI